MPHFLSNFDNWHIDYVRLERNHGIADSVLNDVAFVSPTSILFQRLSTAMTWWQFMPQNEISTMVLHVQNNSNSPININPYNWNIADGNGNTLFTSSPAHTLINANENKELPVPLTYRSLAQTISSSRSYTSFKVTNYFNCTPDANGVPNDTVIFYQQLYNYFSYDDGSAELAYGINQANGEIALK